MSLETEAEGRSPGAAEGEIPSGTTRISAGRDKSGDCKDHIRVPKRDAPAVARGNQRERERLYLCSKRRGWGRKERRREGGREIFPSCPHFTAGRGQAETGIETLGGNVYWHPQWPSGYLARNEHMTNDMQSEKRLPLHGLQWLA